MRNRKKNKTISDFSVSELLDDFLSPDSQDHTSSTEDIDDEEYIRMMLKKDEARQLERSKRAAQVTKKPTQSGTLDDDLKQRFFPDVDERPVQEETHVEREAFPEIARVPSEEIVETLDNGIVEEILDSIVVLVFSVF